MTDGFIFIINTIVMCKLYRLYECYEVISCCHVYRCLLDKKFCGI